MSDQFVEDTAAVEEDGSGKAVAVDEVGRLPEEEDEASFSDSDGGSGEVCWG